MNEIKLNDYLFLEITNILENDRNYTTFISQKISQSVSKLHNILCCFKEKLLLLLLLLLLCTEIVCVLFICLFVSCFFGESIYIFCFTYTIFCM